MRKELKLNLVFFGVLAILVTPGFIILMNKKLSGSTDPNYMPDEAPVAGAYNRPPPVPPRLPRVEPAEARQWVTQLLQQHAGTSATLARSEGGSAPVIGDAFRTQLLSIAPTPQAITSTVCLLIWTNRTDVTPTNPQVTAFRGSEQTPLTDVRVERIDVPKTVRHALQRVGYIDPPTSAWFVQGTLKTTPVSQRPSSLSIAFAGQSSHETVLVGTP